MTAQLAPPPVFRATDNNGLPLFLGQLGTFAAGTTTPQATYIDSTQTTPNTNPVILNFRGECNLWLDPTKTYKLVLKDAFGNLIWTVDNVQGGLLSPTGSIIPTVDNTFTLGSPSFSFANLYLGPNHAPALAPSGNIGYYARTASEIAAGVTPIDFSYLPGDVRRYGADPTGAGDSSTAIASAQASNSNVYFNQVGTYRVGTNLTLAQGVTFSFAAGAALSVNGGNTVQVGGQIVAGSYQIFGGAGNVITQGDYTHGPGVYNVKWWGAKGDNVTDDTNAIQAACNAPTSGVSQGVLYFPTGQYRVLSTTSGGAGIQVKGTPSIKGDGFYSVLIGIGFSGSNPIMSYIGTNPSPRTNFYIRDLHYLSDNSGASALSLAFCNTCDFSNIWLESLASGISCGTNVFNNTWKIWHVGGVVGRNFIVSSAGFNNNSFFGGRFGGAGFLMNHTAGLNAGNVMYGVDFEGMTSTGTGGLYIAPTGTGTVRGFSLLGCYAENATTPLFYFNGAAAANSIRGVTLIGGYFNGGGAGATAALLCQNVNGICVRGNDFDSFTNYVINDLGGNSNWDIGPNDYTNLGTAFSNTQLTLINLTYSASISIDPALGTDFSLTVPNGVAFTINAPTTANASPNQRIRIWIINASGGAMGVITWAAGPPGYKMSPWTNPANGFNRSIEFKYNGSNWYQVDQTGADVTN